MSGKTWTERDWTGRSRVWTKARCKCGVSTNVVVGAAGEPICDECFAVLQEAIKAGVASYGKKGK